MSALDFDAEALRKVIQGQRVTFSGRRLYRVVTATTMSKCWLVVLLAPGEAYGTYPVDEEAEKAYREWCAANARDPMVDEILADTYVMNVFTDVWSIPATVKIRNIISRNELPPVYTLEMSPCS